MSNKDMLQPFLPSAGTNCAKCLSPAACFHNTRRKLILRALPSLASLNSICLCSKLQRVCMKTHHSCPSFFTAAQVSFLSKVRLLQTITGKVSYISQISFQVCSEYSRILSSSSSNTSNNIGVKVTPSSFNRIYLYIFCCSCLHYHNRPLGEYQALFVYF